LGFAGFPMLKSISTRIGTSITIALAATIAGGLAVLVPGVPEVRAEPQVMAAQVMAGADQAYPKSDRLPGLAKGAACSSLGWPNYEQACLFDMSQPTGDRRTVRVIANR
jgi:hypothetical protein